MPPRGWRPPRLLSLGLLQQMRPPWEPGAAPFTFSTRVQLCAQHRSAQNFGCARTRIPIS